MNFKVMYKDNDTECRRGVYSGNKENKTGMTSVGVMGK